MQKVCRRKFSLEGLSTRRSEQNLVERKEVRSRRRNGKMSPVWGIKAAAKKSDAPHAVPSRDSFPGDSFPSFAMKPLRMGMQLDSSLRLG
jgi:hypothetical protein